MAGQRLPTPCRGPSSGRRDAFEEAIHKRSLAARHRDHFRDAEKICSLGQREEVADDDRIYDTARTTR
jgi:hypothetical protein